MIHELNTHCDTVVNYNYNKYNKFICNCESWVDPSAVFLCFVFYGLAHDIHQQHNDVHACVIWYFGV